MIPTLHLKPQKEERMLEGSLWIFRNEIELKEKEYRSISTKKKATS